MPIGLRAADAPLIQRLVNGDMKLLMRLGALLQEGLTVSEPALQALVAGGNTSLLTDRRLKGFTKGATADADFTALIAEHKAEDLVLTDTADGMRVIALADEVGNPLLAALVPAAVVENEPMSGLNAVVATLAPSLRTPVEGLLAARADDQRAAALEQLRYAMPPLAVVCELMPMLLADGADIVRERAIALLMASGAHIAVIDCIRALQRADDAELIRHSEPLGRLPQPQQELVIAAVLAHLARGQASSGVVSVARALAPLFATHAKLERLFDLLLPRSLSLIDLVRALQAKDRVRIDSILARQLGMDVERDAQIIILLAAPEAPPPGHPIAVEALLDRGISLLLAPTSAPRERMSLAAALRRLDSFLPVRSLAHRLALRDQEFSTAFDTSVYWLLAELCRDKAVDEATGELLAEACRRILRDGSGPHIVSLLEQQLPALVPATPAARLSLVEPTVETVARFHDDRSHDVVISCVVALGPAALPGLWASLEDHPRQEVRLLCAELVPDLLLAGGTVAELHHGISRLLQIVGRVTDTTERAALITAAARAAVAPSVTREPELHSRVLSATNGLGDHGMEALGHLAASPACDPVLRDDLLQRMLRTLQEDVPDAPLETSIDVGNQEVTYHLDDALTRHTDTIPRVLRALERIGSAPTVPTAVQRLVIERLCKQWKRVSTWETVWGPGNIRELGETIARLGERADCPAPQRVLAAESLLNGANQLSIARALARVFLAGEGTYLATLAGRASARLVQLAGEDYYADDERPDLVEILVDYLAIAQLGKEDVSLRRRLVNLIATMHGSATTRARLRLRFLRSELDPELRAKIEWA